VTRTFVLVPPSEAKEAGGRTGVDAAAFADALDDERRTLRGALGRVWRASTRAQREKLLGVRGDLFEGARAATNDLLASRAPLLPAWRRYRGVVWTHLAPTTLSAAQRRRLLVPSGLYGLTTGEDLICDYRLKMGVSLAPIGRVDAFWRASVTAALAAHVANATVVDLLPGEHRRALAPESLDRAHYVRVDFVGANGQGAAGHAAKAVKGVVANAVLRDGPGALEGFAWEGWRATERATGWDVVAPAR
jgi:cytoplasmic iron level regulating protein YaaA (DUF328/UPF0246 family)